jgi:hypothetical protein
MFTNQPSWSGSFGLVVTLPGVGVGGPSLVLGVDMLCNTLFLSLLYTTSPKTLIFFKRIISFSRIQKRFHGEGGHLYRHRDSLVPNGSLELYI